MSEAKFGPRCTLVSTTTVWVSRPGLSAPYTLGQVRFADGPQVYCHIRGVDAKAPLPLEVCVEIAPEDDAVPVFWCKP
jgi:uncharacterized OB-fold protein